MAKSIEEQVEDLAKIQLKGVKYYTKTESINAEIETALKTAPSKSGGGGINYPDIKLFIETKDKRYIPVMIEVKGTKGALVKLNANGYIDNKTSVGEPNFANINRYAVNGAVHYATAIIEHTHSFKEVIAIGMNGHKDNDDIVTELEVYYISADNFCIPKKIGEYTDLTFLLTQYIDAFITEINNSKLTQEEIEKKTREYENEIEIKLKTLNQQMQDTYQISVGSRVEMVTGMIMAGLGVENKVAPLEITDLKGEEGAKSHDGWVFINKIDSFLAERKLPDEKKTMIINDLSRVFIFSELWKPKNGESKLKKIYSFVKKDIMPIFTSAGHLDFSGKLFNVLNTWVDIPDSDKNDVVLTPRYVTDLMARLAQVDKDSFVWDFAAGSAGFLISAMKIMLQDAQERIKSPEELKKKIAEIKYGQLLGIEKRADIYLLAVLNMIMMGDGSSNIVHKDSLTEFQGKYEQGKFKGQDYPANVFLLNPPYSALGKGFIFVEKALAKMKNGKAVILIQENAGSGNGLPYTKRILENNSLIASIRMADIFRGVAGVQTAIYVFDIGKKHDERKPVKFIDFTNDGYSRQNRKKASQETNLKNANNAVERYAEIVNLVLYGKRYLHYFTENEYIEDTISLNGNDWTFAQHIKISARPTEKNFENTIREFLSWKVGSILRGEINAKIKMSSLNCVLSKEEKEVLEKFRNNKIVFGKHKLGDIFDVKSNPQLDKYNFTFKTNGEYPYFTRTVFNNGLLGYVDYLDDKHKINGNCFAVGMLGMKFFYMDRDFYAGQFTKNIRPKDFELTEEVALFFKTELDNLSKYFSSVLVRDFEKTFKETFIQLPITDKNEIDFELIKKFINAQKKLAIENIIDSQG